MVKVLVIAAHPDDEILGIGGIVAKHSLAGDQVTTIVTCEGESLRYKKDVGQSAAMQVAAKMLGVRDVRSLKFPDQGLDKYSLTEIIAPIDKIANEIQPSIVYCQFGGDINRDHQILFEAANVVFRPLHKWLEEFSAFYTVSSTEWAFPQSFRPNKWVDIAKTIDAKIKAFECYKSEIRKYPHPRSSKALRTTAAFWGNQCCMEYAEPLMVVRKLEY